MSDLKKSESTNYLFLTAMLRAREAGMMGREKLERMLSAPGFAEACAVAAECGYPDMSGMSIREVEDCLATHRREEIEDIALIVPDRELVDLFRLKYDYHSAKVMVKSDGVSKQLRRGLAAVPGVLLHPGYQIMRHPDREQLSAAAVHILVHGLSSCFLSHTMNIRI